MAGLKMNVEFPTRLVEFKDGVRRVDPVSIKFCEWIESLPYSELITGEKKG